MVQQCGHYFDHRRERPRRHEHFDLCRTRQYHHLRPCQRFRDALSQTGNGTLTLTGSNTCSGFSASGGGSVLLAGTGSLTTGIAGNVYVGTVSPAALTIQDSAFLDHPRIGRQFRKHGGRRLHVDHNRRIAPRDGPNVRRPAQMNTGPGTTNGAVYQSGGTATLSGTAIVGNAGTALSLYSINGGVLNASGGLLIGGNNGQGDGTVNIQGSGVVKIPAAPGFKSDKILRWPPAEA